MAEDPFTVQLLTVAPGEAVWERFGHNAVRVIDRGSGTDVSYNWGLFDFDAVGFLPRLAQGTMLYWMAPLSTDEMLRVYRRQGRMVVLQELALSPAQEARLVGFMRRNARPENAYYVYDYYRDNCSTRVRDVLDLAVGGALREALEGEGTGTTYRWHTRRLLADVPLAYTGIQLVLSERADRPIDAWAETFLPLQLMEHVEDVRVGEGEVARPLVVATDTVLASARPPPPATAESRLVVFLGVGLFLGLVTALMAEAAARGRFVARAGAALVGGGWALVSGVAGSLLLGAWIFTDHVFWYGNENLLQTNPLALPLAVLMPLIFLRRPPPRPLVWLAGTVAVLSVLGLALQVLPWLDQVNGEIIALALPANLGLALALLRLRRAAAAPPAAP